MNKNAQIFLYFTPFVHKNQYFFVKFINKKGRENKMPVDDKTTAKQKLVQFILDLTSEQCEFIISFLNGE